MGKKEELKLFKEIKKVKCIGCPTTYNLTEGKIYDVYGIYIEKFSDRSQLLTFLIKQDDGVLGACPISWFEIEDKSE